VLALSKNVNFDHMDSPCHLLVVKKSPPQLRRVDRTVQVADKAQVHDFCILLLDARLMPTGHRHQGSAIKLFAPYIRQYCRNNPGRPLRNECLEAECSLQHPAAFASPHRM
jgi:hypothetical protein